MKIVRYTLLVILLLLLPKGASALWFDFIFDFFCYIPLLSFILCNDCRDTPCLNGGTCTDQFGGYDCTCLDGWDGDTCEVNIDDCNPNPCPGVCIDGINNYTCAAEVRDKCDPNLCLNGGSCTSDENSYSFTCTCILGTEGRLCEKTLPPTLTLSGPSPTTFNPISGSFCIELEYAEFASETVSLLLNDVTQTPSLTDSTQVCVEDVIYQDGVNFITLEGDTMTGDALAFEEVFYAGDASIIVSLVNAIDSSPFLLETTVMATLSDNSEVTSSKTTSMGTVSFDSLPERTIVFTAQGPNNEAGSKAGVGGITPSLTIEIIGFNDPTTVENKDFSLGLEGWNIDSANNVDIEDHAENVGPDEQRRILLEDKDLALYTAGEGESTVSHTFYSSEDASCVSVRYRFVTSEVPGGYFGSQWNDYFRVSIRSLFGGDTIFEANTMNGLGLAAFDAAGSTSWRYASLGFNSQNGPDIVQVDAIVANVGDDLYDSAVYIDFVKEVVFPTQTSPDGNYMIGTSDPTITPDPGAGVWNSEGGLLSAADDIIVEAIISLGAWLFFDDWENAAAHLDHYLGNSGAEYTIDLESMVEDVPAAKNRYDDEVAQARAFVELLPAGTHSITSVNGESDYNDKSESQDWFYAVGGYSTWGKGKATVEVDDDCIRRYRLEFEYKFYDRYNWDGGKEVTIDFPIIGEKVVTDEFMGRLHRAGVAKEFDMKGSMKETFEWSSEE